MIRNLLVLPTGEELFSGVAGENAITGVTVTRCVNGGEDISPGAVCADMLELSVIAQNPFSLSAGEEVTLYTVDDSGTRTLAGIFIAEKPVWESANVYSLTAYDRVSLLDKDLTSWLAGLKGWPYKLLDFASMVCSECGLELISEEIPNGEYLVQQFSGEGITGRQLMQWAGQIAGRFCRATTAGNVEFAWYQNSGKKFGPEEKSMYTEPEDFVQWEGASEAVTLQVVSEIAPSITGADAATVKCCGKNLFNPRQMLDTRVAEFNEETGLWTVDTKKLVGITAYYNSLISSGGGMKGTRDASKLIRVPPNTPVTIRVNDWSAVATDNTELVDGNMYIGYGWYYADGTCYRAADLQSGPTKTIVSPNIEPCYLDIRRYSYRILVSFSSIQVELGDTATDFEPYREEKVYQSFEEKIYGGSLDWRSGMLTVTHGKIDSYAGEELPEGWISDTGALTEGAQVVYPLEQPYQVWYPPQKITALPGINYLWSDTGKTQVGFHQDYFYLGSLQFQDYKTAPVEKVQIRLTEEDVGAVYPDDRENCNTYILSGNYLLTNADAEALEPIAQSLYELMQGITYTPCQLEVPVNTGVNVGDIITVTDKNGKAMTAYVMSRVRSGQRDLLECTGNPRRDSSLAVNEQAYKALSGKVMELRMDIEGIRAANRDAKGDLSSLELTVEGIVTEVSRQQTNGENLLQQMTQVAQRADQVQIAIQNLQNNGAAKVKTETGYTFDDEGLKISRSDTEMINLLDNTGMYVKRGSDVVLQANNEGVEAMNITVRNYLTVGDNARFENYNNGKDSRRTACFWIGGK